MATATSKGIQELQQRFRRKGMTLERGPKGVLIIRNPHNGLDFEMSRTGGGLNCIRVLQALPGDASPGMPDRVTFGHGLYGRGEQNILAQLAKIGLDVRDRQPKKANGEAQEMEMENVTDEVVQEIGDREQEVARAVDDILSNTVAAGEILHEEVLKRARQDGSPLQRIGQKKYLDWTGRIVDVLKEGWDVDEDFPAQMARLEVELPGSLRRGKKLSRIHCLADGREVWRVLDDGRVFEDAMPAPEILDAGPGVLHKCPDCGFADYSAQAVTMHATQLRDKADGVHPSTSHGCTLCQAVRCTAFSLQTHMRKEHGKGDLCYACTEAGDTRWFSSTREYNAHLEEEHSSGRRRRRSEPPPTPAKPTRGVPKAPQAAPLTQTEATPPPPRIHAPEAAAEPPVAASGRVEDHTLPLPAEEIQRAITAMVTRYPVLEAENAALREQVSGAAQELAQQVKVNGELRDLLKKTVEELEDARAKLAAINKMLGH